jgi:ParB-like chromosome segregation protein Spo0J
MSIVYRRVADLKPDPRNPRLHSKKQIRQIANSIKTFGFLGPVLVDADLNLITGHGRLLAARELGWTKVPTVCVDHLTPEQVCAFRIADNRVTENASWDDRLLAEQLRDLSLAGLDFDIEVTGFEPRGSHQTRSNASVGRTPVTKGPSRGLHVAQQVLIPGVDSGR